MKRYIAWIAGLGLAGVCLSGPGCGGSDVPDPGSDAQAAGDSAPDDATPDPATKADEPVAARADEPTPTPGVAETPTSAAVEPPQTGEASTPKADPSSAMATSEMLAIATAPPPPSSNSDSTPPADASPPPSSIPPSGGAMSSGPGAATPTGPDPTGGSDNNAGFPVPGANPNDARGDGMPIPGPGGAGEPGGNGNKADFTNPLGAVNAFLNALKQRDADLLAESTALRAATESHVNNRKLFTAILDHSLSDDEFDDLIEKLQGYAISFRNVAKSTGRQGIVLEKIVDRHVYRRTIDVRREKAGWKVVDVGGERDLSTSSSGVRDKPRPKKQ